MEETRRFLRFVLPGLIFILELFIFFYFSYSDKTINVIKESLKIGGIGVVIIAFLASGAIGYLLSFIYHTLFKANIDHRKMVNNARKANLVELCDQDNNLDKLSEDKDIRYKGAWRIVTSLWHERKEQCKSIKAANQRIDSLSDIMHGSGTSMFGSLLASILWLVYTTKSSTDPTWPMFIAPILLPIFHFVSYRFTRKDCQGVIEAILMNVLYQEFKDKGNKPANMIISSREYKVKKSKRNTKLT